MNGFFLQEKKETFFLLILPNLQEKQTSD